MRVLTDAELSALLTRLRAGLGELYGDRLVRVVLYGSYARGEAHEESDVDVAVVLRGDVNPYREIDRMSHLLFDLMMAFGPHISAYPLSDEAFRPGGKPIVRSLLKEGVTL
jgi:predicted nucleotidyltransferase